MRTMRTLGTLLVVGGTAVLAYGCSAAGNAPIGSDAADASSSTSPGDYGSAGDGGSSSTTPKYDSGLPSDDGGYVYDAGSTVKPPEGSPCDPATQLTSPDATQTCGLCGTQTRICQGSAPDGGGTFTWAAWGLCTGEVTTADACDPTKTYTATACGNCGTIPQVCGSDCHFESGFDCSEPAGACHPTDTKFVLGASCSTAGQGRLYTCGSTCSFGSPGACEAPPPNPHSLTISATAGNTVNAIFNLAATSTTPLIDAFDGCPTTIDTVDDPTSFIDIGIVNPTSRTVTVSLWDGPAASPDPGYDTLMAWYATPVFPPPDMTACTSANDGCDPDSTDCANTSANGDFGWSSLSGTDAASIPAGGTITLHIAMDNSTDTGNVKVYAKTEN